MHYTVVNNCSAEDKSEMDNNSIKQFESCELKNDMI